MPEPAGIPSGGFQRWQTQYRKPESPRGFPSTGYGAALGCFLCARRNRFQNIPHAGNDRVWFYVPPSQTNAWDLRVVNIAAIPLLIITVVQPFSRDRHLTGGRIAWRSL